jgi:hypothetical protein
MRYRRRPVSSKRGTAGIYVENVDPQAFRAYLRANGLAVIVMRNVTTRDSADRQQPYNLHVPGECKP